MHRHQLLTLLRDYQTRFIDEAAMLAKTRRFVLEHERCFDRNLREGHISGSAWIINPAGSHVFLLRHRKLRLWLQPGGHADNNHDIIEVAMNETAEESGSNRNAIHLLSERIFDLDVHVVHETPHEPRHWHYDIRFLAELDDRLHLPGNDESHAVAWVPLHQVLQLNNMRSMYRMVQKTRAWQREVRRNSVIHERVARKEIPVRFRKPVRECPVHLRESTSHL